MIEEGYLKYFITEDVFLLKEKKDLSAETNKTLPEKKKIHELMVWTHELTEKDKDQVEKILKAVNIDPGKVHLIHHEQDYTDQYKTLLSFGHVDYLSDRLEKEIFLNQPIQYDGKKILVSYPITSLRTDVKKKGELWEGLKKMFSI